MNEQTELAEMANDELVRLRKELERVKKEAAAIREALDRCHPQEGAWENRCHLCGNTTEVGAITHKKWCPFEISKVSDAGRDFISREQVKPLANAVRAMSETVLGLNDKSASRDEILCLIFSGEKARVEGLAIAEELGI